MNSRVLALSCAVCAVFAASCVQGSSDVELISATDEGSASVVPQLDRADAASEPIEEAAQDWTRADCISAWKHNGKLCNSSPPNARAACFAAVAAMLAGCLAGAQG